MKDLLEHSNDLLLDSLGKTLAQLKDQLQLNQLEIGPLTKPVTIEFYEKWLAKKYHADMGYLVDHLAIKKSPQLLNTNLQSIITVSQAYFPTVEKTFIPLPARVAMYAQNKDYHFWLRDKLLKIISELKSIYPDEDFLPFVDSGPVLERNWAFENGLGWFGKNTCLIHPKHGSLFFIAEIFTSIKVPKKQLAPLPDFCGKCQKCIEICPTGALVEPHVLKSDLCISYLTIEAKTAPPIELRSKMGDWFFGCDLCQTTCPWNEKVFRGLDLESDAATNTTAILNLSDSEKEKLIPFFKTLLNSSNKKIAKDFTGTALMRAGGNGLKRNALIVIANRKIYELKEDVRLQLANPKLSELANWCLDSIDQKS